MASTVTLIDTLSLWAERINGAAQAAPGEVVSLSSTRRLTNALQAALDALDGLKQAEEQAASVLADQSRSGQNRVDTSDQLRTSAADKANSALAELRSAADAVAASVSSAWHPKQPAGADGTLVTERKHDLERVLEAESGGLGAPKVIELAARMLSDALRAGDADSQLTAYVLTSCMDLYYRSLGITPAMRDVAFANAAGAAGGALAPLLGSGADTLAGFIQTTQSEIASTIASMKAKADQWAVILSGQGQYKPGQLAGKPASVDPTAKYLR